MYIEYVVVMHYWSEWGIIVLTIDKALRVRMIIISIMIIT